MLRAALVALLLVAVTVAGVWATVRLVDAGCTCDVYAGGACAAWDCPEEGR